MLNFTPQKDVSTAQNYPWQGDYLGTDMVGQWIGDLAEELGLSGEVDKKTFDLLCENKRPDGSQLTPYNVDGRLIYTDATFNAPKSFSVLYDHFSGTDLGDRVLEIFRREVRRSVRDMEKEMQQPALLRDEEGHALKHPETGKPIQIHPFTGNLLAAEFIHFTARPVEGIPDPHLHAHIPIFNATKNLEDNAIRSAYLRTIRENAPLHEARFHSRLSMAVSQELGFKVSRDGKGFWRIAGVPHSVDRKFSRRTETIEDIAQKIGAGPKAKAELAKLTREAKGNSHFSLKDLHGIWHTLKTEEERAAIDAARHLDTSPELDARCAIERTLASELERQSVISERDLLIGSLKRSFGSCSIEAIEAELGKEHKHIIKSVMNGVTYYTTKEMFEKEQAMFGIAREGRGTFPAFHVSQYQVQDELVANNAEQVAAIRHVLSSNDQIMSVVGGAGVGKTTMAKEMVRGIEESGFNVFAMAPTNDATDVLRQDGFKRVSTLDRFLKNPEKHREARGQVVWCDESGLISVNKMLKLFEIAEDHDFRVILIGDDRQHSSVEAGDALRLLHQKGVVKPAVIRKIVRQRNPEMRAAIKDISIGNIAEGFDALDSLSCIQELCRDESHHQLANDYLGAVQEGKSTLIVAPTHREGHEVTKLVRAGLKKNGILDNDRQVMRLEAVDTTLEQRRDATQYQSGQVLEFHQKARGTKIPGFQIAMNKKGETFEPEPFPSQKRGPGRPPFEGYKQGATERGARLTVIGRDGEGHVYAKNDKGKVCLVPLWDAEKFSVHEPELLPLSPGDKIRFTGNGQTKDGHRIINGRIYDVASIRKNGDIEIRHANKPNAKPWVVSKDFGHLNHGYVTTSIAAQGATVDKVFIAESVSSGRAASMKQFYVSTSRAREGIQVYTEDKEHLLDMVRREGDRLSASELVEASTKAKECETEAAQGASLALVEMVAKHIQWEKAKAKALGLVHSVKEAAASVAQKAIKAGISPVIGQQALAMAGGLGEVKYVAERPNTPQAGETLSRAEIREQAAELGRAFQPNKDEPLREKKSPLKQVSGWVGEPPSSGDRVTELKAEAERTKKTREAEMKERRAAQDDGRGFADKTDARRWDIRAEQQTQREKERKTKNKKLLNDMANRLRAMRNSPE